MRLAHAARLGFFYKKNGLYKFTVIIIIIIIFFFLTLGRYIPEGFKKLINIIIIIIIIYMHGLRVLNS